MRSLMLLKNTFVEERIKLFVTHSEKLLINVTIMLTQTGRCCHFCRTVGEFHRLRRMIALTNNRMGKFYEALASAQLRVIIDEVGAVLEEAMVRVLSILGQSVQA